MRPRDPTLAFQFREVAASGGFGDIELFADFEDRNIPHFAQQFGDGFPAGFNDVACDFHKGAF